MTLGDITRFIVRTDKYNQCFPGWTAEQISWHLAQAMADDELYIALDSDKGIVGVIHATINLNAKEIFVHNLVASDRKALQTFVKRWFELYPGLKIRGRRSKIERVYSERNFRRFYDAKLRDEAVLSS